MSLPLLLAACTCPAPPCAGTLVVEVSAEVWEAGRWTLDVAGEGLALSCTVDVVGSVGAPTLADVVCNDRVERSASVLDTAGLLTIDVLELRGPVAAGVRPASVHLVVGHDAGQGRVVRVDEQRPLTWAPIGAPQGTCSTDCAAATVALTLP